MEIEKRMAGEYEITQSILIGDREVVFGINDNNPERPYFCAFYERNELLGKYDECMVSDDYAELVTLFAKRIEMQCEKLKEAEQSITVPREKITVDMCRRISYDESIEGKVVVISPEALRPEYQTADNQLCYVTGGFGASANSRGTACYCINLYSGKESRFNRSDILGEMKELPEWAIHSVQHIRETRDKEKAADGFLSR